jgi:hypothetical protein
MIHHVSFNARTRERIAAAVDDLVSGIALRAPTGTHLTVGTPLDAGTAGRHTRDPGPDSERGRRVASSRPRRARTPCGAAAPIDAPSCARNLGVRAVRRVHPLENRPARPRPTTPNTDCNHNPSPRSVTQ